MKKFLFPTLIVAAFLMTGCSAPEEAAAPNTPTAVRVMDLSVQPTYRIEEVGTIKAAQEIELIAKAAGTVGQISHQVGDPVANGEVIAVIDYDKSNSPAEVNYESAQLQLSNAQQSLDETRANNQDSVTRTRLRLQTLESTLARLQRNLNELLATNESTRETLELRLANAEKNADTAQVNYENMVAQFEQSLSDLLTSTKTNLDSIFANLRSNFLTVEGILNPTRAFHFNTSVLNKSIGATDSIQRNDTVNLFNEFAANYDSYQESYEDLLPLTEANTSKAVGQARTADEKFRVLLGEIRIMLSNSLVSSNLSAQDLESYKQIITQIEAANLADISVANKLEQSLQGFKLDRTSQLATADNNRIIANNQLAEAENALLNFDTTSRASVQDLETQIAQTSNDVLSAQADLTSAERSASLQNSAKVLEINTYQNQLRLAERSLEDNEIASSINGVLADFEVDEGDYVTPGMFLGRVIQYQQVKVVFYVSEENAGRIWLGQPFIVELKEDGLKEFTGAVSKIAPSADPLNKKIRIEGIVGNQDLYLTPEMFVVVGLDLSKKTFEPGKIYVPMNSIIFAQNAQYVYVIEENTAVRKSITIGDIFGSWVEVTGGLKKNDLLIVEGHRNLPPSGGVEVNIIE